MRALFTRGNDKTGPDLYCWSLPAGKTCPGASTVCARECYAQRGRFRLPCSDYRENLKAARAASFVTRARWEIARRFIRVLRIHVAGDFFSAAYVRKWVAIARSCPQTTFLAYTRSWRVPTIRAALRELAALPNVRRWCSCDRETGLPRGRLSGRIAWMQTEPEDLPSRAGVLFRVQRLRKTVPKRVALPLATAITCPVENGATGHRTNCQLCRICWR